MGFKNTSCHGVAERTAFLFRGDQVNLSLRVLQHNVSQKIQLGWKESDIPGSTETRNCTTAY